MHVFAAKQLVMRSELNQNSGRLQPEGELASAMQPANSKYTKTVEHECQNSSTRGLFKVSFRTDGQSENSNLFFFF
jgi:hypothetical protein